MGSDETHVEGGVLVSGIPGIPSDILYPVLHVVILYMISGKSRCTSHIWSIFIDAKSTENLSFCFFQSNRIPSQSINKKSYGFKDQQCGHDPTP